MREVRDSEGVPDKWLGLDIGPASVAQFRDAVLRAGTVVWNGPMGVFEFDNFGAHALRHPAAPGAHLGSPALPRLQQRALVA